MAKPLTILRFMICCKVLFIFQFFKSSNAQLLRRVLAKVFPIEVDFLLLSVNWKKVNPDPTGVCFEAQLNDHSFGVFKIKERGLIYSFKLVHVSGKLSCSKYFPSSYWGCTHWSYWDKKLLTVITYPNKTALPLAQYRGQSDACRFTHIRFMVLASILPSYCLTSYPLQYLLGRMSSTSGMVRP